MPSLPPSTPPSSPYTHLPSSTQSTFPLNNLTFSSSFCSGNLLSGTYNTSSKEYNLTTSNDASSTDNDQPYTTWFHFSVDGGREGEKANLSINNMNKQKKLYSQDYRPMFKIVPNDSKLVNSSVNQWQRLPNPCVSKMASKGDDCRTMVLKFRFSFDGYLPSTSPPAKKANDSSPPPLCDYKVFFAFCYPHSYSDLQKSLSILDAASSLDKMKTSSIYYHREVLTYSRQRRRCDLITITDHSGISKERESLLQKQPSMVHENTIAGTPITEQSGRPNERSHTFDLLETGKQIIFISTRVHPGETPAQHIFNGILNFLLNPTDPRSIQLRRQFVFKLVPMLNPDGVSLGHYRTDCSGLNLNRFYDEPCQILHPTIFAVKDYLVNGVDKGDLKLYLDLHAHASKRGCFIYGNDHTGTSNQIASQLYPKLISNNSQWFEYSSCDFSAKGMSGVDKRDNGLTKEGSGRVGVFKATGCVHCYTLEGNYNEGLATGAVGSVGCVIPELHSLSNDDVRKLLTSNFNDKNGRVKGMMGTTPKMTTPKYTINMFENVGEGCVIALLDMTRTNPLSRIGGEIPLLRAAGKVGKGVYCDSFSEIQRKISEGVKSKRNGSDNGVETGSKASEVEGEDKNEVRWSWNGKVEKFQGEVFKIRDASKPSSAPPRNNKPSSAPRNRDVVTVTSRGKNYERSKSDIVKSRARGGDVDVDVDGNVKGLQVSASSTNFVLSKYKLSPSFLRDEKDKEVVIGKRMPRIIPRTNHFDGVIEATGNGGSGSVIVTGRSSSQVGRSSDIRSGPESRSRIAGGAGRFGWRGGKE